MPEHPTLRLAGVGVVGHADAALERTPEPMVFELTCRRTPDAFGLICGRVKQPACRRSPFERRPQQRHRSRARHDAGFEQGVPGDQMVQPGRDVADREDTDELPNGLGAVESPR